MSQDVRPLEAYIDVWCPLRTGNLTPVSSSQVKFHNELNPCSANWEETRIFQDVTKHQDRVI